MVKYSFPKYAMLMISITNGPNRRNCINLWSIFKYSSHTGINLTSLLFIRTCANPFSAVKRSCADVPAEREICAGPPAWNPILWIVIPTGISFNMKQFPGFMSWYFGIGSSPSLGGGIPWLKEYYKWIVNFKFYKNISRNNVFWMDNVRVFIRWQVL